MISCSQISAIVSRFRVAHSGRLAVGLCFALAPFAAAAPASAPPPPLTELLDHVGHQVEKLWSYFSSVTCTETVTQAKLGDRDKVLFTQKETFDYLMILQSAGLEIAVDESRIEKTHTSSKGNASLLETNGFSIFSLIFHPLYQSRFQFESVPDESPQSRLLCISFRQVVKDHPLSVLHLRDRDYPLEWRGKAWIDPDSWAVVRVQAGLGDSMADFGLLRLDADVTYSDVRFSDSTAYWLPARAVIEAETKRQHWRNTHLFAGYKRFSVETDVKLSAPH
jgi:hypothetical protein